MTVDDLPDWPPAARPVHTHHLPEETPMSEPGLRQRVTDAINHLHDTGAVYALDHGEPERIADAVLAVVGPELDQLRAEVERLRAELAAREQDRQYLAGAADRKVERLRAAVQQALGERDHHSDRADTAESAVERAHHLAERWDAEGAWTVRGTDGTESAAAELLAALDGPATTEEPCDNGIPCPGTGCSHEQAHAELAALTEELGLYPDQQAPDPDPSVVPYTDLGHPVGPYRADDGRTAWRWSCHDTDGCYWLSLEHDTEDAAKRSYERHRERECTHQALDTTEGDPR